MTPILRVLCKKQLKLLVPYTGQHISRLEKDGKFPKRLQLGPGRVGWLAHEVEAWINERVNARDNTTQNRS
jgi:prophage regulatory protein